MIYSGDKFPMWVGDIFSGGLIGEQLARVHLDDEYRNVVMEETLAYDMGRIRDVRQVLTVIFTLRFLIGRLVQAQSLDWNLWTRLRLSTRCAIEGAQQSPFFVSFGTTGKIHEPQEVKAGRGGFFC